MAYNSDYTGKEIDTGIRNSTDGATNHYFNFVFEDNGKVKYNGTGLLLKDCKDLLFPASNVGLTTQMIIYALFSNGKHGIAVADIYNKNGGGEVNISFILYKTKYIITVNKNYNDWSECSWTSQSIALIETVDIPSPYDVTAGNPDNIIVQTVINQLSPLPNGTPIMVRGLNAINYTPDTNTPGKKPVLGNGLVSIPATLVKIYDSNNKLAKMSLQYLIKYETYAMNDNKDHVVFTDLMLIWDYRNLTSWESVKSYSMRLDLSNFPGNYLVDNTVHGDKIKDNTLTSKKVNHFSGFWPNSLINIKWKNSYYHQLHFTNFYAIIRQDPTASNLSLPSPIITAHNSDMLSIENMDSIYPYSITNNPYPVLGTTFFTTDSDSVSDKDKWNEVFAGSIMHCCAPIKRMPNNDAYIDIEIAAAENDTNNYNSPLWFTVEVMLWGYKVQYTNRNYIPTGNTRIKVDGSSTFSANGLQGKLTIHGSGSSGQAIILQMRVYLDGRYIKDDNYGGYISVKFDRNT